MRRGLNVSLLNRRGLLVTLLNQLKKKPVGTIDIETVLLVESIAAASKSSEFCRLYSNTAWRDIFQMLSESWWPRSSKNTLFVYLQRTASCNWWTRTSWRWFFQSSNVEDWWQAKKQGICLRCCKFCSMWCLLRWAGRRWREKVHASN